ncbi:MAG: hypothetical protein JXA78_19220 [Anaerolineales bacterium]|nr:hypothetical protein [Anaerolineales bacterium]
MNQQETVADLFKLAISVEESAGELYKRLEAMFAHEAQVAQFWRRFAEEEANHAGQLRELLSKLNPEQLAAPADPAMLQNAHRILAFSIDSSLDRVQDLEDAYQLAHELESSEANAIFDFLITHFAQDQQSRDFLREQLRGHILKIENEFPIHYRGASGRRKVPARKSK